MLVHNTDFACIASLSYLLYIWLLKHCHNGIILSPHRGGLHSPGRIEFVNILFKSYALFVEVPDAGRGAVEGNSHGVFGAGYFVPGRPNSGNPLKFPFQELIVQCGSLVVRILLATHLYRPFYKEWILLYHVIY